MISALRSVAFTALIALCAHAQTTPKDAFGFNLGDDYRVANYTQLEQYWSQSIP